MVRIRYITTSPICKKRYIWRIYHFPEHKTNVVNHTSSTPVKKQSPLLCLSRGVLINTLQFFSRVYARGWQGSIIKVCLYVRGAAARLTENRNVGVPYIAASLDLKVSGGNVPVKNEMNMLGAIDGLRMVAIALQNIQQNIVPRSALNVVRLMTYSSLTLNRFGLEAHTNGR